MKIYVNMKISLPSSEEP